MPNISLILLSILFSLFAEREAVSYFPSVNYPTPTRSKASMVLDDHQRHIYSFFGASSPTLPTGTVSPFPRVLEAEPFGGSPSWTGIWLGTPSDVAIPGLLPQAQGSAAMSFYYEGNIVIYILGGNDGTNTPFIMQWIGLGQSVSTMAMTLGGTSGMTFVRSTADRDLAGGRGYYFGGIDKTGVYHNEVYMYNFTSMITTTQWATEHAGLYDGVKPAARAYHSAVITGKTEDMFIFGGESGGSYFSDLWRLSPVRSNNTYQWTQIFPSGAAPCARSGHEAFWAKTSSTTNDESGFYIFGGTNGTHVFNDLWYFSIATSSWTQVVPDPAQAPLSPRAYYSVVVWYSENNGSFAFMYGGIDSTLNVHDDSWSIISLSDIYIYCINNVRRRENCENVAESIVCSVSSTTPFKCNLDCFSTPIGCSSMFECPSNQTTCWDGTCKPSLSDCYPIQRCGVFQKRCSDGGCKAENDPSCQANLHCTPPLQLCADGSCSSSCPKYRGCLPDSKPILCADGSCASSSTACNAQCYPKISCYGGCFYDECPLTLPPPLFSLVDIPLQTRVIDDPLDCEDCNKTLLLDRSSNHIVGSGAPYTDGTPSPLTYFSTHVDPRIMESAGPYPTWTSQFNYSFFYTVAVNLTVSGNSAPGNISLFLEYFGPRTENPQQDKCVGTIVPWYWSMNDLSPRSAFINDSFVVSVKALIASTGSSPSADSDFFSIPNISSIPTPKYRWNCIFSAGWYVPSDFGSYQKYGIYFQNPMSGQVITIMATPSWETPWPPVDKPAHYAVLGVAAGVLVTVLTVVIIKAAHRET